MVNLRFFNSLNFLQNVFYDWDKCHIRVGYEMLKVIDAEQEEGGEIPSVYMCLDVSSVRIKTL